MDQPAGFIPMPPKKYAEFTSVLMNYVDNCESGIGGKDENDDTLEGDHPAVAASKRHAHDSAAAAKFLLALHEKGGQKITESFLARYDAYQAASETAFFAGNPQPKLKLLGYEKDILGEHYSAIEAARTIMTRRAALSVSALGVSLVAMADLLLREAPLPTKVAQDLRVAQKRVLEITKKQSRTEQEMQELETLDKDIRALAAQKRHEEFSNFFRYFGQSVVGVGAIAIAAVAGISARAEHVDDVKNSNKSMIVILESMSDVLSDAAKELRERGL